MSQKKQDKIQKQLKVQGIYRKVKQQSRGVKDDKNDNKIGVIIVNICVVLAVLGIILKAFF
ncbi:hypothetical protein LZ480_06800 [Solibacillus sp. MA9]|uniref:Uncharacterized protein n=1 Tax=Solibacillus palustris TaxID=2908203 RepID=A0ABS9UBU3_9BACL|nr:hypothetical protein [Solibacillus sp. MA9]MCH7321600.1 hypothetical protein [Solibacillus sp. MA9]